MSRWTYFARRLVLAIPVVLFGTTITFVMLRAGPLDPAAAIAGPNNPRAYQEAVEQLGLNEPLWKQYLDFMGDLLTLDLGQSEVVHENRKVTDLIVNAAPRTIWLGLWSVTIAIFIGIPLGFYAGLHPNTWGDYIASFGGILWRAMPNFWLALILARVLGLGGPFGDWWIELGMRTQVTGPYPMHFITTDGIPPTIYFDNIFRALKMVAPAAIVLGSASMGNEMRIGRTAVLETINSKYVETAKAKGVSNTRLIWKHVFRNALIPLVPIILNEAFLLIGGSIIIETIFAVNGIGYMFFQAAIQGDVPLAGALTFIFILIIVSLNIMQDLLYTIIDPRVGYER